jgi:hypothetical protein
MTCAACNGKTDGEYLHGKWNSYKISTSDSVSKFMTHCSSYLSTFGLYKEMLIELIKYVETVKKSADTTKAMQDLKAITPAQMNWVQACDVKSAATPDTCALNKDYLTTQKSSLPQKNINIGIGG